VERIGSAVGLIVRLSLLTVAVAAERCPRSRQLCRELARARGPRTGRRLTDAGYEVVFDPELFCLETRSNTVSEVLSRYARWNLQDRPLTLREYRRQIGYAYKSLLPKDWRERNFPAAVIALLLPHYLFWRR
jgi:hypothetical protein